MSRTLTLATWNVNSLKVRLPHLLDWLATHRVDIVCLQETKLVDENFPVAALAEAGYAAAFAGQKTYNGVALLTRRETTPEASDVVVALPGLEDPQKRLIGATVGDDPRRLRLLSRMARASAAKSMTTSCAGSRR